MATLFTHMAEGREGLEGNDRSIEKRATRRFRSRRAMMVTVLIIALAVSFAFLYSLLDGHHTTAPSPRPSLVGWGGVALNEVTRTASGNPVSSVFPGETAIDLEYGVQEHDDCHRRSERLLPGGTVSLNKVRLAGPQH